MYQIRNLSEERKDKKLLGLFFQINRNLVQILDHISETIGMQGVSTYNDYHTGLELCRNNIYCYRVASAKCKWL